MSILVFGLTNYYSTTLDVHNVHNNNSVTTRISGEDNTNFKFLIFVSVYIVFLIVGFFSKYDDGIFAPWKSFSLMEIAKLGAAIALTCGCPPTGPAMSPVANLSFRTSSSARAIGRAALPMASE